MNFNDLSTLLFGSGKYVLKKDQPTTYIQTDPNIIQRIGNGFSSLFNKTSPVPSPAPQTLSATAPAPVVVPVTTPVTNPPSTLADVGKNVGVTTPQPLAAPTLDTNTIKSMIAIYGGIDAPLNQYADQLAGATQYDFWKNNPELLALIPFQETTSGRNVTRPNNLTNWGISVPGNNETFSQMTKAQVLDRFISGLGERSGIYKQWRTGKPLTDQELIDLGNKYVDSDGKTYGDTTYATNLVKRRADIRQKLGLGQ
jgi:hypothetical protein